MSAGSVLADPPDVRRLWAAARGRNFHLLWFGEGVSVLGSATTSVLLPLLAVTHLHAGPGWMGAITASAWLPWLVVGLPAGAWVDRLPARAVMIAADLVSAAVLVSVPIAWGLGVLGLAQLVVVALAGGVATVFFRTAYVKLLPLVVADEQLESANARLFGTESAAQVAGPGIAGLLAGLVSAAAGLLLDVVSFLVSALCLARIRTVRPSRNRVVRPAGGLREQVGEGVRVVRRDRHLRVLTLIGGASNFGLTGYQALLVVYLVDRLGLRAATVGVVVMLGSAGGLLGATVARPLARRIGTGRASTALLVTAGPAAVLVGLPTTAGASYLSVVGLVLVGAGVVGGNVVRGAWRQRYVPEHLMGRVVTAGQMVNYGTMPLAGLAAGVLGAHLGVRATVLVMAAIHALACLSILGTSLGRLRELPDPPAQDVPTLDG